MKAVPILLRVAALGIITFLISCSDASLTPKEPVVLTLWQVYGGQTNSPMNETVEHFNQTVGRREGITVNVTSISNSTDIHFALVAAAENLPGAAEMPDMFITYPKTALAINPETLMDWNDVLDEKEREKFVPSFIEEGTIHDRLVLLPVAKSSSALFINATIFDQFSHETGVRYENLTTWEGMFDAAKRYYQWSGGKAFFKYDDWLHYGMVNTASLGGTFFKNNTINFQDDVFKKIWHPLAIAGISGEVSLLGGYATTGMMTGEVLCGIESTSSVLYFKDKVTFPDNTTIPLRLKVLPVPCFEGGKPLAIQRGGGLGVARSTPKKEQAAAIFGKWLTAAENNVPLVITTGYMPVHKSAYRNFLEENKEVFPGESHIEAYNAVLEIHKNYDFYIPPFFEEYGEVERRFSNGLLSLFKEHRQTGSDPSLLSEELVQSMLDKLESIVK